MRFQPNADRRPAYRTMRSTWAAGMVLLLSSPVQTFAGDEHQTTTVGMPARIEQLVLPGSELEVKPLEDDRTPIVARITGAFPHGTDFRYDIVYYGLEPGKFDLTDYLRRKDGSATDDLPAVSVEITPVLPPGQIVPNELEAQQSPDLGGYRKAAVIGGIAWCAGLVIIIWWNVAGSRKKRGDSGTSQPRLSLADRLRPIVQDALAGKITQRQQAELERMLLAFWRKRLNLNHVKAVDAITALREHDEAGGLLKQLEIWLHRPGNAEEVDLTALLKPYQDLPADDLEM